MVNVLKKLSRLLDTFTLKPQITQSDVYVFIYLLIFSVGNGAIFADLNRDV